MNENQLGAAILSGGGMNSPSRETEVSAQVEHLNNELERLSALLRQMETRLVPVLSLPQEKRGEGADVVDEPMPEICPLAATIRQTRTHVEFLCSVVERLTNRLEV